MTEYTQRKAESDKRILEYLNSAKKDAHQSILSGTVTLEELDRQKEVLESIEQNLDGQEEVINQSLRKIRGMTWSGAFYNLYSDVANSISSTIVSPISGTEKEQKPLPSQSANSTNVRQEQEDLGHKLLSEHSSTPVSEEDKLLEDIANAASALKALGLTMGQQLEDQNQHLETIERKTEQVHDNTLAVSIKASQLTQKQAKKDRYVGCFQFMNTSNSLLLSVNGENLELTDCADPSTLFRVVLRQDTIVGLQSERTGKFVGITMWGSIAVSGNYFGTQEECFLELTGNETGILFIAKNWGAGGWLKTPLISDNSPTTNLILNETTKSANDRENRMILKAIRCR